MLLLLNVGITNDLRNFVCMRIYYNLTQSFMYVVFFFFSICLVSFSHTESMVRISLAYSRPKSNVKPINITPLSCSLFVKKNKKLERVKILLNIYCLDQQSHPLAFLWCYLSHFPLISFCKLFRLPSFPSSENKLIKRRRGVDSLHLILTKLIHTQRSMTSPTQPVVGNAKQNINQI